MAKGIKGFFKNLAAEPVKQAGEAINKGIDQTVTNLEEAQEKLNQRLKIDSSGSWLSKNIRPLIVLWIMSILTLSAYDIIKPAVWFQDTIRQAFILALSFYFVERGIRYTIRTLKNK